MDRRIRLHGAKDSCADDTFHTGNVSVLGLGCGLLLLRSTIEEVVQCNLPGPSGERKLMVSTTVLSKFPKIS